MRSKQNFQQSGVSSEKNEAIAGKKADMFEATTNAVKKSMFESLGLQLYEAQQRIANMDSMNGCIITLTI